MSQQPELFGIPNCDSVKRARSWLSSNDVDYTFRDLKKEVVNREALNAWIDEHGWEKVLNKRGTTFRKLPDSEKQNLDREKAATLLMAHPSMVKRPILVIGERTLIGFDETAYSEALHDL